MTGKLISFVSLKGGARKSSHLIGLAAGLLDAGHTVRVLDSDPQGTSEQWLNRAEPTQNSLEGRFLDLGNMSLDEAYDAVSEAADGVEYTLLDTPGASTPAVSAALLASDLVLTPFRLTEPEVDGLATTRAMFESALRAYGEDPEEANNIVALYVRGVAFISNAEREWLNAISADFFIRSGLPETSVFPRWMSTGRTAQQLEDGVQPDPDALSINKAGIAKMKNATQEFAVTIKDLLDA